MPFRECSSDPFGRGPCQFVVPFALGNTKEVVQGGVFDILHQTQCEYPNAFWTDVKSCCEGGHELVSSPSALRSFGPENNSLL